MASIANNNNNNTIQTITEIIDDVNETLKTPKGSINYEKLELLTNTMTEILQNMAGVDEEETKNVVIYDDIVKTWKDVLVLKNQPSNLQTECFKLFSAIANCTEETFMKYLKVMMNGKVMEQNN